MRPADVLTAAHCHDVAHEAGVTYSTWPGCPMPAGSTQHVALQVADAEALTAIRERIKAHGVRVSKPVDHDFCMSIYFEGPGDVQLEITYATRAMDDREFDPEVLDRLGITADELARLRRADDETPVHTG